MADNGIFSKLVSSLSAEERKNLFDKLKTQSNISSGPLYHEEEVTASAIDISTEFSALPWYSRFWLFILSLIRGKPAVDVFAERQVSALAQTIEERSPSLYDNSRQMLLPAFCRQIEKLKEAARFFYTALDTSVSRDKGAFFAFLGSIEMPEAHNKLLEETDPAIISEKYPDKSDTELRQLALRSMDDALTLVSEAQRGAMYFNARSLNCLKGLSSFLYDRIIMAFKYNSALNCSSCSVNVVRELLVSLNNVLLSLRVVPPLTLLESLFIFILQERTGEPGFDMNKETRLLLEKADESIGTIRDFNKNVPLTWILRCSEKNMLITPHEISGGEDWFVVYRDYWRRRIDFLFADYFKDRRRKEMLNSFRYFLKGHSLRVLSNTSSDSNSDGMPIKGTFALSFLYTFYSVVFMPDINKILRPIMIDGDFEEKETRVEFAESYNILIKLEDDIKSFEHEISPDGDYGKRYAAARQEISLLQIKRRKIQIILDEAQVDSKKIIDQVKSSSRRMVNILGAFRGKDTRGRYGGLANIDAMGGNFFVMGIDETVQQFQKVLKILDDIEAMEEGR